MRVAMLFMVLLLGGCAATQPAKNPLKAEKPKAEKKSKESKEEKEAKFIVPFEIDKVELMQEMYLLQKDMNDRILLLAEQLTPDELKEFNEFLAPYGTELRGRLCDDPTHDHSKPGHKPKPKSRGEAF
jgi:hypothetical protein